jgi:hypothetical protein
MTANQSMTNRRLLLLAGCLLAASQLQAQFSITRGDLYVYQIGNNTTGVSLAEPGGSR